MLVPYPGICNQGILCNKSAYTFEPYKKKYIIKNNKSLLIPTKLIVSNPSYCFCYWSHLSIKDN